VGDLRGEAARNLGMDGGVGKTDGSHSPPRRNHRGPRLQHRCGSRSTAEPHPGPAPGSGPPDAHPDRPLGGAPGTADRDVDAAPTCTAITPGPAFAAHHLAVADRARSSRVTRPAGDAGGSRGTGSAAAGRPAGPGTGQTAGTERPIHPARSPDPTPFGGPRSGRSDACPARGRPRRATARRRIRPATQEGDPAVPGVGLLAGPVRHRPEMNQAADSGPTMRPGPARPSDGG
jgi:hypothetical protein